MTQISQLIAVVEVVIRSLTPERVKYWMENLDKLKDILVGEVGVEMAKSVFKIDYALGRAAALAPGKFRCIRYDVENGWFPIGDGVGEKILVGDLVGLGFCRNTAEAQKKIEEELKNRGPGWRAMIVREFSAFVGAHPELCKDKSIGILGSVGENVDRDQYVAYFRGTDGYWDLDLRPGEDGWGDGWCFAVVLEL